MVEKRIEKFRQGPPPPFSGNARKKTVLFIRGVPLFNKNSHQHWTFILLHNYDNNESEDSNNNGDNNESEDKKNICA